MRVLRERPVANVAAVRLVSGVDDKVSLEQRKLREGLFAARAGKRFVAVVSFLVRLKSQVREVFLVAFVALETLLPMYLLVAIQFRFGREFLVANFTQHLYRDL